MEKLDNYEQSQFWKRVDEEEANQLKASVESVAEQSEWISRRVSNFLPQYTLHDETHLLNVLSIMDALVPDAVMEQLAPLECALCIMAAYTHDLGMVLPEEERKKIFEQDTPERQRFLNYRNGFGEELRQIERWKEKGGPEAERCVRLIEGHIRASFIRETHVAESVAEGTSRIETWLDKIAEVSENDSLYSYGNDDFERELALIGLSHGKSARWLREELKRCHHGDFFLHGVGADDVNLAFPGLLLRLADIMDFDASRTPRILFKHIGIENDENERSILEWKKHLAVKSWTVEVQREDPLLKYRAKCEHPVHEKTIREFASQIDRELSAVRSELRAQRKALDTEDWRYRLRLPEKADLNVSAVGHPDDPVYHYEDIEFRLDQDEIQQLLLGESLWGDPKLCIRELLQNALDALRMRDLRLEMRRDGEEPAEPVDPLRRPGQEDEKLEAILTWGHDEDSGQDYLLVRDHGVGMTKDVIVNYFTQIGKSFYGSPDFERERRVLSEHRYVASPISIFGIGILSSFMIADRLHVRTRPGEADENERRPYDITISGPGSLFWLKEGTLEHQGTEVKLFLKPEYRIEHDAESFHERLRKHFGYEKQDRQVIDPAFIAASHVVWPLYPVVVQPLGGRTVRIDDGFHTDALAPLDKHRIIEKAEEWDCSKGYVGDPEWGLWEWTDAVGDEATGSRVRLWFPCNYGSERDAHLPVDPSADEELCRQDELAAFAEPQLPLKGRTVVTVKGMRVNDIEVCEKELEVSHGVGGRVWVDLRGGAAPRLTADRREALAPGGADGWRAVVQGVFHRMREALKHEDYITDLGAEKNLLSVFRWRERFSKKDRAKPPFGVCSFVDSCLPSWFSHADLHGLAWSRARLLQGGAVDLGRDLPLPVALACALDPDVAVARDLDLAFARAFALVRDLDLARDLDPTVAHDFDLPPARDPAVAVARDRDLVRNPALVRDRDLARDPNLARTLALVRDLNLTRELDFSQVGQTIASCFLSSLLQEAFFPHLAESLTTFGCFPLEGSIGDAMLDGPGRVVFDFESDGRTVHATDLEGNRPADLVRFGYDLVFPMTAIPVGALRKECSEWRADRRLRSLGVALFLFPELDEVWQDHAETLHEAMHVERIFALLPRFALWSKPFDKWTEEEWQTCGYSVLWDIEAGRVLWAEGRQPGRRVEDVGLPFEEFLEQRVTQE